MQPVLWLNGEKNSPDNMHAWGMMLSSNSSCSRGGSGRSSVRNRNGDTFSLISLPTSKRSRSASFASDLAMICWLWIRTFPWNILWITLDSGFVLDPPRSQWTVFRSHDRNSSGSLCSVSLNCFPEAEDTSWSSSWGDTCPRNALAFHIFRIRILSLWTFPMF